MLAQMNMLCSCAATGDNVHQALETTTTLYLHEKSMIMMVETMK
jgi:hypothetical protein